jgi:tetratricopeptide (TPR) repeat protein
VARVQLFLSTVSAEFLSYRKRLRHLLTRPDVEVKVQEDFIVTGDETLEMLDTYIKGCDGVIHLVGDMTGAMAKPQSVAAIASRYPELASRLPLAEFLQPDGPPLSYTQWEAWLALWHGKKLYIATPSDGAPRDENYCCDPEQQALQHAHLARLRGIGRYPGRKFTSQEELVAEVSVSFVLNLLVEAGLNPNPHTPHNLPDRTTSSERFVGRDAELQRLAELLTPEGSRVYLTGMGGVGKSELALQYAFDALEHFSGGIVRLDARQGLAAMASQLVLFFRGTFAAVSLPDDKSPIELLPLCWSKWPANANPPEPVLLILDDQHGENLDDQQGDKFGYGAERQLFAGLPSRFRRLITQREVSPTGAQQIDLPLLQRAASRELLTLQAGMLGKERVQAEEQAADELCEEVGDLALALVLLGARMAGRPDLRVSQLLEDLRAKGAEAKALQQTHPELGVHRGVVESLLISWEPLSGRAKSLALLFTLMGPAVIPWELVERCSSPQQEVVEGSTFGDQQEELLRCQLLKRVGEGLYQLHPLVQHFLKLQSQRFPAEVSFWQGQLAPVVSGFCKDSIHQNLYPNQIAYIDPFIPHITYTMQTCFHLLHGDSLFWPFTCLAYFYENQANFKESKQWLEKCIDACTNALGDKHHLVASSHGNLGRLMLKTHDLSNAAYHISKSLEGPQEKTELVQRITSLAHLYKLKGNPAGSADLMLQALNLAEDVYGKESLKIIPSLNNAGEALLDTNRETEAENLFLRALDMLSRNPNENEHARTILISNIALLKKEVGKCDDAINLISEAKQLAKQIFDERSPDLATVINNWVQITIVCAESSAIFNENSELEEGLKEVIKINTTCYGKEHPNTITSINNLALLYQRTGRLEQAEALVRNCIEVNSRINKGENLAFHARLQINLGTILHDKLDLVGCEQNLRSGLSTLFELKRNGCFFDSLEEFQNKYHEILTKMDLSESEIEIKTQFLMPPSPI